MPDLKSLLRRKTVHLTPARIAQRSLLRTATQENNEAYLALVSAYTDLANRYFGMSCAEPAEQRQARTAAVFVELWRNLRFADRVSDFEFMLANTLIDSASAGTRVASTMAMVTKCRLLSPRDRFVIAAYEMGDWNSRQISLALRIKPKQLHRTLSEARCELCGVSWDSLSNSEKSCLEAISLSMDKQPNVKQSRALLERASTCPRVTEIKAEWLELRAELVEVKVRYQLDDYARERIFADILNEVAKLPMKRPRLVQKLVNTVHFSRHPSSRVS